MQFIDLSTQQTRIRKKLEKNIHTVLDHGKYILGPEIKSLEDRLAKYVGAKHSIGCAPICDEGQRYHNINGYNTLAKRQYRIV